jgi:hypothetical protein
MKGKRGVRSVLSYGSKFESILYIIGTARSVAGLFVEEEWLPLKADCSICSLALIKSPYGDQQRSRGYFSI